MSQAHSHPYHLVDPSPWPFAASMATLVMMIGAVLAMHDMDIWTFYAGFAMLVMCFIGWWRDVINEGNTKGIYTGAVQLGLKIGMALFITSEVMFFAGFFWSYFYAVVDPVASIGGVWPPKGIVTLDPFELPYLNTLILLLSGTTVTWAHHELLEGNYKDSAKALLISVVLGVSFSIVQALEYSHATFAFKGGIYSSNFYMATGFHGVHVIIGTIFLFVCWWRLRNGNLDKKNHIGFEAAAWYWHFVDVVWLFLFIAIYWWGHTPQPVQ